MNFFDDVYMSTMNIYEEEGGLPEGVLGCLQGPLMEVTDDNNNDRDYTFEFIDKNIYKSEYTQKMMGIGCLFGEAGHPIDRFKIDLMSVSHSVVSMWWDESKTHLMGKLYIYDTPAGRIIMTLVKAGCKLGISIRARGTTVKVHGRKRPDPNNYVFKGFDIVPNPGFESARLEVIDESDDTVESQLISLIQTSSEEDLKVVRQLLDSLDEETFDRARKALEDRTGDTDETDDLNEEVVRLKEEIYHLRQNREIVLNEESEADDNEELARELMNQRERNRELDEEVRDLTERLSEAEKSKEACEERVSELEEEVERQKGTVKNKDREIKSLKQEVSSKENELDTLNEEYEELQGLAVRLSEDLAKEEKVKVRVPKKRVRRTFLNESVVDRPLVGAENLDESEDDLEIRQLESFVKGIK